MLELAVVNWEGRNRSTPHWAIEQRSVNSTREFLLDNVMVRGLLRGCNWKVWLGWTVEDSTF